MSERAFGRNRLLQTPDGSGHGVLGQSVAMREKRWPALRLRRLSLLQRRSDELDPCEPSRLMCTGPAGGMVAPVDRGRHVASLAGALGLPLNRAT